MSIYAIADLHLSFDETVKKPMDIYGGAWINHAEKLEENWRKHISDQDVVLLPGDLSWGLRLSEALADLEWIHRLPGQKVLLKGNHDLWWAAIGKLNRLYGNLFFLQNTFFEAEGLAICGSRGWLCPGDDDFTPHDNKIYERELLRLEYSLSAAKKAGFTQIIGMMHYPPANDKKQGSGFTQLFEKYGVQQVVYGHLHGTEGFKKGIDKTRNGVSYRLVSLDYLKCTPLKLK